MKKRLRHILRIRPSTLGKVAIGLMICLLISLESGYAQEVDKSRSNKKKLRETKFKTKNKQGDRIHKGDITGRKTKKVKKTKNKNKVTSPSSSPYNSPHYGGNNRRKEGKQVQTSDGYFNTPSRPTESHRKGDISGRKTRKSITRTGEGKPVRAQPNPYAKQQDRSESQRAKASRAQGGGFQSITQAGEGKNKKRRRIQPRTASRAFVSRGKVNAYAGRARRGEKARTKDIAGRKIRSKNFKSRTQPIVRPSFDPYFARKKRGDQPHRALNGTGYATVSKKGEQKYKGSAGGGYISATKKGENAWRKDITGRDFRRPRDPGIVVGKKGKPFTGTQNRVLSISGTLKNNGRKSITSSGGGGSVSNQIWKGKGKIMPRRDLSTPQIGGFAGNVKGIKKPLKGGGSISSNIWQGKGKAIPRKDLGSPQISGFAGNVKGIRKPLKGGGSISNNIWKGKGQAMPRKDLGSPQISGFAGNVKGIRKPLKGGGSISNNIWKGKGQAMPRKDLRSPQISGFAGNVKGVRKPLKGGGSISNNIWKGKGQAIPRKDLGNPKMSGFAGNIKGVRKPLKGGGSITKSGWNNNRTPLIHKFSQNKSIANFKGRFNRFAISPGFTTGDIGKYQGNIKSYKSKSIGQPEGTQWKGRFTTFEISPGYLAEDIGNYQGNIKGYKSKRIGQPEGIDYKGTLKMKSKYKDKPHAVDEALKAKEPHKNMYMMSGYQGKIKDRRDFRKKPNAHEDALKGIAPKKAVAKIDSYIPRYAKIKYSKKPNAHEDALKGIAPKKAVANLDSYIPKYAKVKYSKKPNAHEDALKGIAPKNSASKAMAFQGNFKVQKNYDRNMHPSSKYTTSLHPGNSLKEKERLLKFNIWWAKLFKKNENQPDAVKEKTRNPRYDKREKDLWYD